MKFLQGQCRICLDDDFIYNLLIPCKCKGTSLYVHKECLDNWRYNDNNGINSDAFNKCGECQTEYQVIKKYPDETFFITNSYNNYIYTYYIVYYLLIFVLGYVLSKIDHNSTLIDEFNKIRGNELINSDIYSEHSNLVFYFGLINSIIFFIYLFIFFIIINIKVNRKCTYWKHNILIWLITLISIFFIIPIYIFSKNIDAFNMFTLSSMGCNLLLSIIQISKHNKTLYNLNHKYNIETYIEYPNIEEI